MLAPISQSLFFPMFRPSHSLRHLRACVLLLFCCIACFCKPLQGGLVLNMLGRFDQKQGISYFCRIGRFHTLCMFVLGIVILVAYFPFVAYGLPRLSGHDVLLDHLLSRVELHLLQTVLLLCLVSISHRTSIIL